MQGKPAVANDGGLFYSETVIASKAKQSIAPHREMDCFVAEPVIGGAFAQTVGSSQRR
jgi:hypothetical protein